MFQGIALNIQSRNDDPLKLQVRILFESISECRRVVSDIDRSEDSNPVDPTGDVRWWKGGRSIAFPISVTGSRN
jgi:hypothetical protein